MIGIEVRDANNNIVLSMDDMTTEYLGTITVTTSNGSFTDSRLSGKVAWFFPLMQADYDCPWIRQDGASIKWEWQDVTLGGAQRSFPLMYGVY